jgi:hypothetical protein
MSDKNSDNKYMASIAWANTVLWLGFWFLLIGGCTSAYIWGK